MLLVCVCARALALVCERECVVNISVVHARTQVGNNERGQRDTKLALLAGAGTVKPITELRCASSGVTDVVCV